MKIKVGTGVPKHLLEEMEKDKPSADPAYWAKPGCKNCHGRGILGVTTMVVGNNNRLRNEELCSCARKKWQKWQDDWYAARQQARREAESSGGNGASEASEEPVRDEKLIERVKSQVRRLDERIATLRSDIVGHQSFIDSLEHHKIIAGLKDKVAEDDAALQLIAAVIEDKEEMILRFEAEAEELLVLAKDKCRQASKLRQIVEADRYGPLAGCQSTLDALRSEQDAMEKDLTRVSHSSRKKIREAQRQIGKLERRRQRIMDEIGLDFSEVQDSFELEEESPTTENHTSL